jgi:hypothetical protein
MPANPVGIAAACGNKIVCLEWHAKHVLNVPSTNLELDEIMDLIGVREFRQIR